MLFRGRFVEARAMKIEKLDALKAWQLMLAVLGLGVVTALIVWAFVWVLWTIRPFLAAAAAVSAVVWVLVALHRHRRDREWSGQEWIGS
jgi:membrane protein YdbS with pleckstrin-like domain